MVDTKTKIELYSNAAVFCLPFDLRTVWHHQSRGDGLRNAGGGGTAVGGIKEVVVHGETGYLVSIDQMQESPFEPVGSGATSRAISAARINRSPWLIPRSGKPSVKPGRRRAEEIFGWPAIAQQTAKLYESLIKQK